MRTPPELRTYIETHSIPIPFVGCWLWLRSIKEPQGYGQINLDKKNRLAHRVSFEAFKTPIPDGMLVQHGCDNRWCVNPDHLSLGTDATNQRDALLKGRTARKLQPDDVRAIRARLRSGESQRSLAREYGVSATMIRCISRRTSWAHIDDLTTSNASEGAFA